MRFSVFHETHYRYSAPVCFGPHLLRLTPRAGDAVSLAHDLVIEPAPRVRYNEMDRFGNSVTRVEFEGEASRLRIESRFDLETRPPEAIDMASLPPLPWPAGLCNILGDYSPSEDYGSEVASFTREIASQADWNAAAFLERLNETLFTRADRHIRPAGAAQTPALTLATWKGACRDLTVLFMAVCRSAGIPARFVSGYQAHADTPDGRRHLHSWAEIFAPGSGWRGFDPMHGLRVTDGHVALCAAPEQAATMPVEGGYYGDGVTSDLSFEVRITAGD